MWVVNFSYFRLSILDQIFSHQKNGRYTPQQRWQTIEASMDQIYFLVVSAGSEILRGFKNFLVCRHTNIGKIEMIPIF